MCWRDGGFARRDIPQFESIRCVCPLPAPRKRDWQPVEEIVRALGERYGVPVIHALANTGTTQMKDVEDPAERQKLLIDAIALIGAYDFSGKKLLLVDDLYRSGTTLSVATHVLKTQARADRVCVLTMTKTRG